MHDTVSGSQMAAHRFPQMEAFRRPTNDTARPPCRPGEWQVQKGAEGEDCAPAYLSVPYAGAYLGRSPISPPACFISLNLSNVGDTAVLRFTRSPDPDQTIQSSVPPARTKALGTNARPNEPFPCVPAPVTNELRQLGDGQRRPISFGGTTNWGDSGIRQLK